MLPDPPGGEDPRDLPHPGPTAAPERPIDGARHRARASGRVAAGILVSRISGLAREAVFAHYFGASAVADVWRAALRTPNVLQNLMGEGTLSASFIPVYSGLLGDQRKEDAAGFAGVILGLLTVAAGALAFLGILVAPLLVAVLFAGFDPERQALTIELVRILFPMTALLVVSAWSLGVLNSHRRFFLPYVAPLGWNASMIGAMLAGSIGLGASGDRLAHVLAWGALLGAGVQLGVQLPAAVRLAGRLRPSLSLQIHGVRECLRNLAPVVAARGAVNLSGYFDYFLAAFLTTGAVAVLGYAQTLYLLPISLFALSVAASELPELSRDRLGATKRLTSDVGRGVERVLYFLAPSAAIYLLVGDAIVGALFQRGAFGPDEVRVTWVVLAAYALGMPASAVSRLLSSAFYALRDTRTPARAAYLRVALSTVIGVAVMVPMDRVAVGSLRLGAAGLAVGASVGAWTEWFLLRRALGRRLGSPPGVAPARVARILVAACVAGGASLAARTALDPFHPWILVTGTLLAGGGVYLAVTAALGVSGPLRDLFPGPDGA